MPGSIVATITTAIMCRTEKKKGRRWSKKAQEGINLLSLYGGRKKQKNNTWQRMDMYKEKKKKKKNGKSGIKGRSNSVNTPCSRCKGRGGGRGVNPSMVAVGERFKS